MRWEEWGFEERVRRFLARRSDNVSDSGWTMERQATRHEELRSWTDFSGAVAKIRAEFATHTITLPDEHETVSENNILFRGAA